MSRYAGSIAALQPDDVLTFLCPACGHRASVETRAILERASEIFKSMDEFTVPEVLNGFRVIVPRLFE